jgi:hypothetical protein
MGPRNGRALLEQLAPALDTLERTTGVKGRIVAIEPKAQDGRQPDALIDIYFNGKKHHFVVEAKTHLDRLAALGQVKAQLDAYRKRGLLFAPYITAAIARQCRRFDIPFLDTAGNVYLHERGLLVFITGEKPGDLTATTMGPRAGGTAAALRVVFVLLCNPDLLNAPYRNIVEAADVALGAIGPIFFDLEKRGYIAGVRQKHNRRFLQPARLFEEWVTNYPITLRPKLNPRRFRAENAEWWKVADLAGLNACWGGEIAAQKLTKYLKPQRCTLYIKPTGNEPQRTKALAKFIAANRLRADAQGDIELLDAFWNLPPNAAQPDVVPPILAYADLIATLDPRNIEVAKRIREEYIDEGLH